MYFLRTALLSGLIAASVSALGQTSSSSAVPQAPSQVTSISSVQPIASMQGELSLEILANRLNLTETQLKLWNDFASRVYAWEQNLYKEHPVWSADANVAAEMSRIAQNQQNRLILLEDMEISIKVLYAGLNQEQQRAINASLLQVIPGLLPNSQRENSDSGQRREGGRFGSGGSGRRRAGGMGGLSGMN